MNTDSSSILKVNIACGPKGLNDWVNIEYGVLALLHRSRKLESLITRLRLWPLNCGEPWPNIIIHDCRKGLPCKPGTVDFMYCSHFVEHLPPFDSLALLVAIREAMRPGGVFRLVLPDLDMLLAAYAQTTDPLAACQTLNEHFYSLPGHGDTTRPGIISRLLWKFQRPHQWQYNEPAMRKLLVQAGFSESAITRCAFQQGRVPDIDTLDAHPDESMYFEIEKTP